MSLSAEKISLLREKAASIRRSIVAMLIVAKSGHLAGAMGMADIFAYLYFHALKHDPKKPDWEYRDRLVLSNGHICPVLYATLAHAGYFPHSELKSLRKLGSRLQGHPDRKWLPMVETSSGPLGCGLSQAVGMALGDRLKTGHDLGRRIYCIMSDGELDEGNSWEAAMLAAKEKLSNLTVIVDRNRIQLDGNTEEIMPLEPLAAKWSSWNWKVKEIDGNDFAQIEMAMNEAKYTTERPTAIIARTIPAKGIPAFEGKYEWHGRTPVTKEEIKIASEAVGLQL